MKYFDKAFFKFTLGFLGIVCASLAIMFLASNLGNGESQSQTAQPALRE